MTVVSETSKLRSRYQLVGYINGGTYGMVFLGNDRLARRRNPAVAIKMFRQDALAFRNRRKTGLSKSALREMSLGRELKHPNIIRLKDILTERMGIFLVYEYAELDLTSLIEQHRQPIEISIPEPTIKSIMYQVLNGLSYMHRNNILHRDIKPGNILIDKTGSVKIGDLGLSRRVTNSVVPIVTTGSVVSTRVYRAPEIVLGSNIHTQALDIWAVGCVLAELLSLNPIFDGGNCNDTLFQKKQMVKIVEILGLPQHRWQGAKDLPYFQEMTWTLDHRLPLMGCPKIWRSPSCVKPMGLEKWHSTFVKSHCFLDHFQHCCCDLPGSSNNKSCASYDLLLLQSMLEYDPEKRISAADAMEHPYFLADRTPDQMKAMKSNCFAESHMSYHCRQIETDHPILMCLSRRLHAEGSRKNEKEYHIIPEQSNQKQLELKLGADPLVVCSRVKESGTHTHASTKDRHTQADESICSNEKPRNDLEQPSYHAQVPVYCPQQPCSQRKEIHDQSEDSSQKMGELQHHTEELNCHSQDSPKSAKKSINQKNEIQNHSRNSQPISRKPRNCVEKSHLYGDKLRFHVEKWLQNVGQTYNRPKELRRHAVETLCYPENLHNHLNKFGYRSRKSRHEREKIRYHAEKLRLHATGSRIAF